MLANELEHIHEPGKHGGAAPGIQGHRDQYLSSEGEGVNYTIKSSGSGGNTTREVRPLPDGQTTGNSTVTKVALTY